MQGFFYSKFMCSEEWEESVNFLKFSEKMCAFHLGESQ